jgi:hypothetical protein
VVGDSLNPVVDAIRRHDGIDWVHVRHEEAGAFAAGAEAQLTGRLVACAGSCGPDNLHLINGLYDAHRSMAPVLAVAAQIPSTEIGTGYFQETHALPDRPEDPGLRRHRPGGRRDRDPHRGPRRCPRRAGPGTERPTGRCWSTCSPTPTR